MMTNAEQEKLVLITGATGKSGRYCIERLAARRAEADAAGYRFRALVRPSSDASVITGYGLPLELCTGDVSSEDDLRRAMAGVDTLLHIVGIRDSERVLAVAAAAGVRRAILVHTTGAYSKYKSAGAEYCEIDARVTAFCAAHAIGLTILRPTMIYGGTDDQNVITFIRMVDRLPVMPVVNRAMYALQPVHRRDLGHAYADALLASDVTNGKNYDLSGGAPILLRDMLSVIAAGLGKKPRFVSVPYPLAYTGACVLYSASLHKLDVREKVQRLVEPRAYPHEAATADFGYAPMGFTEGVQGEIAAYLAEKQARAAVKRTKA